MYLFHVVIDDDKMVEKYNYGLGCMTHEYMSIADYMTHIHEPEMRRVADGVYVPDKGKMITHLRWMLKSNWATVYGLTELIKDINEDHYRILHDEQNHYHHIEDILCRQLNEAVIKLTYLLQIHENIKEQYNYIMTSM